MRGPTDHPRDPGQRGAPTVEDVATLLDEGRHAPATEAGRALADLEDLVVDLETGAESEPLMQGLHARAVLLRRVGAGPEDCLEACDDLQRAATSRREPLWTAVGHALRSLVRIEAGQAGAAIGDLALADLDLHVGELAGTGGFCLLDALAQAYSRLRLVERAEELRQMIDADINSYRPQELAEHWSGWAAELTVQALEPLAMGAPEPDLVLLGRAVDVGEQVSRLPMDTVSPHIGRGLDAVRALGAAYRGRPSEALRTLGQDAFGEARDLPPLLRQIATLAAMKAHAHVGSIASARSLDEAASATPAPLVHVVLDVCRARERLWLETHTSGSVVPVLHRLTELLVRLGWHAMDLVADTARQALEQHAVREESRTDALTGVGNRRALDEELRQLLRFSPLPLSLVLVDIDDFKLVNDRFTHVVGDEVLRRVAEALSEQLRGGDRLLRYGGDEFVVLLPATGDQEAHRVAARMAQAVTDRPWGEVADGLRVTVTTGCAALWSLTGRRPDADAERLFRRADEALLAAKRRRGADLVGDLGSRHGAAASVATPSAGARAQGSDEVDHANGHAPRRGAGSTMPFPEHRESTHHVPAPPAPPWRREEELGEHGRLWASDLPTPEQTRGAEQRSPVVPSTGEFRLPSGDDHLRGPSFDSLQDPWDATQAGPQWPVYAATRDPLSDPLPGRPAPSLSPPAMRRRTGRPASGEWTPQPTQTMPAIDPGPVNRVHAQPAVVVPPVPDAVRSAVIDLRDLPLRRERVRAERERRRTSSTLEDRSSEDPAR